MKRFLSVMGVVILAFLFFSFLSRKDIRRGEELTIFIDRDMDRCALITQNIERALIQDGYRVHTAYFDPGEIDHFLIANPSALYVTDEQLHPDLFFLKSHEYLSALVAVTNRRSEVSSISGDELLNAYAAGDTDEMNVLKKVIKSRLRYGVISFQNLNLHVKPLSVDGIFPSLTNIKDGKYKYVLKAGIYHRVGEGFLGNNEIVTLLDSGMEGAFSLIAGGDIMLDRGTKSYITRFGVYYPFEEIRDEIQKHDIAFANLESPISERGKMYSPFKGIYFRADPTVIQGLTYCGFDVLSLANNHSLDWGIDSILDTMYYLQKAGIRYSGVGFSREQALTPAVFEVSGVRIAFICFNDIYPLLLSEAGRRMETLSLYGRELEEEIGALKEEYDIVIASVHAGTEYVIEPEGDKIHKMRSLIDAGALVVLGSHPHVVQGIEVYRGGLIAYSLGNLIFDQSWSRETSLGILLEIGFLGGKPVYYLPHVVSIKKSRAKIIENADADSVLSYLHIGKDEDEHVKN